MPTLLMPVSILAGCWTLWLFVEVQRVLDFDGSPARVERVIGLEKALGATLVPRITVPGFEAQLLPNHFAMAKVLNPDKKEGELWPETGPSINLVGRRLGFADLNGAVLPRANLTKAKLGQARLFAAKLPDARLASTQLQGAYLGDAQLQRADLGGAQLQGAYLGDAQLQRADLGGAQLQGADLRIAQLQGADLRYAQLQGAALRRAQLQGADLSGARLDGADLTEAELQGADLGTATMLGSTIADTALLGAELPENAQLTATSGSPRWEKPDTPLREADWAKAQIANTAMQIRLAKADQRIKTAKPQTLPQQDPQQFAQAWLNAVCQQAAVAKAMLRHTFWARKLPTEITDTALRDWMKTHAECQPYQAMAEQAIKNRGN